MSPRRGTNLIRSFQDECPHGVDWTTPKGEAHYVVPQQSETFLELLLVVVIVAVAVAVLLYYLSLILRLPFHLRVLGLPQFRVLRLLRPLLRPLHDMVCWTTVLSVLWEHFGPLLQHFLGFLPLVVWHIGAIGVERYPYRSRGIGMHSPTPETLPNSDAEVALWSSKRVRGDEMRRRLRETCVVNLHDLCAGLIHKVPGALVVKAEGCVEIELLRSPDDGLRDIIP